MKMVTKILGLSAASMLLASTAAFALGSHDALQQAKVRNPTSTLTINVTSANPATYKSLGSANDMSNRNFHEPMGSLVSGGPEQFQGATKFTIKFNNKHNGSMQNQQLHGGAIQQEINLMVNNQICHLEVQENFHHEVGNHKNQSPITTVGNCGKVKITAGKMTPDSATWNVALS